MAPAPKLSISCHCGAARQAVHLRDQLLSSAPQEIDLCHCEACRHNTGLLCVSYAGIERPDSIEGLVEYRSTTKTISRFFCATCGCHIFWRLKTTLNDGADAEVTDGAIAKTEQKELWAVATGVIIGLEDGEEESNEENGEVLIRYAKHINTAGTKDGGLSPFIRYIGKSKELEVTETPAASPSFHMPLKKELGDSLLDVDTGVSSEEEVLNAFCHCKSVQFHITRPNAKSKLARSNFPDLMVQYRSGSPQIRNPEDNKWWLRPGLSSHVGKTETLPPVKGEPRRYLAGTCACRSCRLISGFEIQTWAFVPRANIFFHVGNNSGETDTIPLDFATLPPSILTSYESREGVRREFCSHCGATVFWRDRWRPELIDVSVGLLDADEGARAETWLDWWTGRVSFAEDAGLGRTGETARRATHLIDSLEEGLKRWSEERENSTRDTSIIL
ncbi:hypothetical protein GGS24DRAFT_301069 [Hypoxylon argillaceum]|nr:hypothetical protein GGS24DRAFT_301069 [Hypoxylon argillaceum]